MSTPDDRLARRLRADADRLRASAPAPAMSARIRAALEQRSAPVPRRNRAALAMAAAAAVLLVAGWATFARDARPATADPRFAPLPELDSLVAASTDFALDVVDETPVLSEYAALAADASAAMDGLLAHFARPLVGLADAR